LHTWKIERGHNQDLSEQISESKTLGLQVLYCGICCHWGTQKKNRKWVYPQKSYC